MLIGQGHASVTPFKETSSYYLEGWLCCQSAFIMSCKLKHEIGNTDKSQLNNSQRVLKLTCRRVLATKHSITEPLSSCKRWTSSMINNFTSWASATSPVLLRVTTSHFSGVVTSICTWKTKYIKHHSLNLHSQHKTVNYFSLQLFEET